MQYLISVQVLHFGFERAQHKTKLAEQFKAQLRGKRVVCLDIPDNYKFMAPALVKLLKIKVTPFLPLIAHD
jgi:predicted protein tyrosine phosphatase